MFGLFLFESFSPSRISMSSHTQSIYEVFEHQKAELLIHLLKTQPDDDAAVVFVRTRDSGHALTAAINQAELCAESILGGKKPELRDRALRAFKDGKLRVLVTTGAMARELDGSGVRNLIHVDFPELGEDYQRGVDLARAAEGEVITFVSPKDVKQLIKLEAFVGAELPRKVAPEFSYDAQPINEKPPRKKGGTSKGLHSKPLQNKKPKFKSKRGR